MPDESSTANWRAWVEIDLGALVRNARALAAHARVPLVPMIKADAYGTGAVQVARALRDVTPWAFGVATVAEGAELRDAGIDTRIIVFTPLIGDDIAACAAFGLTPTFGDAAAIAAWRPFARPWHLAVDTGMNRAGVRWDRTESVHDAVRAHPPEAAFTHYHSPERDDGSVAEQDRRFAVALESLPVRPALTHTDNSAAIVRRAVQSHDMVRPGVFLYGVGSGAGVLEPEPVVHLRARVLEVTDVPAGDTVSYGGTWRATTPSRIATVGAGYADGYRRHLSNAGRALLGAREVPVVGTVTMDMTMLDVTGGTCVPGDVATMIGRDASQVLTVEAVAQMGNLSPYELLTGLRQRLPRVYVTNAP